MLALYAKSFLSISSNSNVTELPFEEVLALIMQLGNQYSSEFIMDEDRNVEVDRLLTAYYKGEYDISEIMKTVRMQSLAIHVPYIARINVPVLFTRTLPFKISFYYVIIHNIVIIDTA